MQNTPEDSVWHNPLVRHLAGILALKLVLLTGLWWAFFDVPDHSLPQAEDIANHIASPRDGAAR